MYALSSAVESLENASGQQQGQIVEARRSRPQELDLFSAIAQGSQNNGGIIHHLDSPAKSPHINLQDLAKSFMPYMPPPPPVPLAALQEAAVKKEKASRTVERRRMQEPTERRSYKTTLTIYEHTYPDGQRVYETRSTPLKVSQTIPRQSLWKNENSAIEESDWHSAGVHGTLPANTKALSESRSKTEMRGQPFLTRMHTRQIRHQARIRQKEISRQTSFLVNEADRGDPRNSTMMEESEVVDNIDEDVDHEGGEEALPRMTWRLISVKRQRKLKMKKHKYKKLLKRTKNIRRRLDRL